MPISIDALRSASGRAFFAKSARTLSEARSLGQKSVFLCHSHHDADAVQGLISFFGDNGWLVYVDWQDAAMPEKPNRETAQRIQHKIRELEYFIFLATRNSVASRWCPWEIGFADSAKPINSILIVPTSDNRTGEWYGNEYLQLYRKIDLAPNGNLAVWGPGETQGVWLSSL
jgi:hypothetical protein